MTDDPGLRPTPVTAANVSGAQATSPTRVQTVATGLDLTSAQQITLDLAGRGSVGIFCRADRPTTFHVDVSYESGTWPSDLQDHNPGPDDGSYGNSTFVLFEGLAALQHVRLRSDAAGGGGDTVDLVLQAPGV